MGALTTKIPTLVQAAGSYFGGMVLYHPAEANVFTDTQPQFGTKTYTAQKLIGIIPLTDELIMDTSINIINYITGLTVRNFQYQIEGEVIQGGGSPNGMLGILNDPAINIVDRITIGTVCYQDLLNLDSSLDENFQDLQFLTRRATANVFRAQVDTNSQPVYHDTYEAMFGNKNIPTLLGWPCFKTRNVPSLGNAGDLILGDLGYFIWALRQDMTIDMSKDVRFYYDETVLRFVMRYDGSPGVDIAFSALAAQKKS
jgi:HK97 family phage major capsid protein